MNLTEEEKKVFGIKDDEKVSNPAHYIDEDILFKVYNVNVTDEMKHKLNVMLGYMKKQILEVAKKKNYKINGDESFDVDELLVEVSSSSIFKEDSDTLLVNFDSSNYKNSKKMNNYFYQLTETMSWEEVEKVYSEFNLKNDGFRKFFVNYVPNLIVLIDKLYKEIEKEENKSSDFVFNDKDEMKSSDTEKMVVSSSVSDDMQDDDWSYSADDWDYSDDDWGVEYTSTKLDDNGVDLSEENLMNYMKFINTVSELMQYRDLGINTVNKLRELVTQKKLEDFYSNEDFSVMFDEIMEHDKEKSSYYFHGTQSLEDAESIIEEGLGMMRDDLTSTSYREFTKDEVILYERGFGGEIGHDAVVIIDVPKDSEGRELNVVEPLQEGSSISFSPSGLQGLDGGANYVVNSEHIVGYVDKRNKQIVFNPKYRNYDQFLDAGKVK